MAVTSNDRGRYWPVIWCILMLAAPALRAEVGGVLLIADAEMRSSFFSNSVVLVAPHGSGAFGVILNQPIPGDPEQLYPEDKLLRQLDVVYFGGPVNPGALVFLFRSESAPEEAVKLFGNVYFSSNREVLAEQMERAPEESGLQVYVGYAGWAPGQLQMEIMHGDWSTREVDLEILFEADRRSIWEQLNAEQIENWI